MSYIVALAFLLLKSKYENEEFKDILEISKEALKLGNTTELTKDIEELLKKSQNEYNKKEAEASLPSYKAKEVAEQKKEEAPEAPEAPVIEIVATRKGKPDNSKTLVKVTADVEKVETVENNTIVIPPVVNEKAVKKVHTVKVLTPKEQDIKKEEPIAKQTLTNFADKKNAYENMLKDVLKGLATNASFNKDNDLIITFDTKSWDGLSNSEQDEIINVLKYQVGKLKRDLKGSNVSGHVSLVGSGGQSLNTFYVQTVSDGQNGSTTVVF